MIRRPRIFRRTSPGRWDDEDDGCRCPSPWGHPMAVAAATVVFQVLGEVVVRKVFPEEQATTPEESNDVVVTLPKRKPRAKK